jgi:hypothetical protein
VSNNTLESCAAVDTPRGTYVNTYLSMNGYTELRITNNYGAIYSIKVDDCMVTELMKHHWSITFVGHIDYKSPRVYTYILGKKVALNKFVTGTSDNNRIVFINRNQYDYRRSNLSVTPSTKSEFRDRSASGKVGMNNISVRFNRNNEVRAYVVRFKDADSIGYKTFSVSKFGSQAAALKQAQLFRDMNIGII